MGHDADDRAQVAAHQPARPGRGQLASTVALAWGLLRADAKVAQMRERVGALDEIALFAPLPNVLRERIATQLETVTPRTRHRHVPGRVRRLLLRRRGARSTCSSTAAGSGHSAQATSSVSSRCSLTPPHRDRAGRDRLPAVGVAPAGLPLGADRVRRDRSRHHRSLDRTTGLMPVAQTIMTTPSRGSPCSPIWIATRCATSRRRRRPPATTKPRRVP